MSRTYTEVMQEIETLRAEAEKIKRSEIADVIDRIKQAIAVYGLSAADLGFTRAGARSGPTKSKSSGPKAAGAVKSKAAASVKYRDGANTWVGRGPRPKWLRDQLAAGKSLKDFAV